MSESPLLLQHVPMSDPVFDQVSKRILDSFKNACVLWIQRVSNARLEENYQVLKAQLMTRRPSEAEGAVVICEKQLFHGTNFDNIEPITQHGFDPTLNKTSAFGRGTYFAAHAAYSKNYGMPRNEVNYMMLCDVLVGRCARGTANQSIDTEVLDNFVDNLAHPTIYVTPYQYGAIPRYVVAFHRDAR